MLLLTDGKWVNVMDKNNTLAIKIETEDFLIMLSRGAKVTKMERFATHYCQFHRHGIEFEVMLIKKLHLSESDKAQARQLSFDFSNLATFKLD